MVIELMGLRVKHGMWNRMQCRMEHGMDWNVEWNMEGM